jgi:hypothetical protein
VATLCALAVAAGGATATASASAALPEVGRCVAKAGGAYKGKGCVALAAVGKPGAYEWEPGPGAKPQFEASLIASAVLETVGGVKISCGPSEIVGEWTGAKTATVNLAFHGCQDQRKRSCTTPEVGLQKESEIKTEKPLDGEIGFISGKGTKTPKVGIDFKSKSSEPMLTFTCAKPPAEPDPEPTSWTVEGSVIGELKPIDVMRTEAKAVFRAVSGKQIPEKFEEGVKDVPVANYGFPTPSKTEEAGLTLREELKTIVWENAEPLELKAK